MSKMKLFWQSAGSAIGVLAYIMLVAWIMSNGERLFGEVNNFIIPVVMLLLFVFSATVTGLLVLGRPVYLLVSGQKNEAVKLFSYTLLWMLVIFLVVFNIAVFV